MGKKSNKIIKQVSDSYIKRLKISRRRSKKPVIVAMVGLIGSGKTIVAQALSGPIGATVVTGDAIRVVLRKRKQPFEPTRSIAERAALYLLKRDSNVVIDADFVTLQKRKRIEIKAKKVGAKVVYVRTIADRDIMIERLIKAKYNPNRDLFKTSTIAVREMWRRTPHHYLWTSAKGGYFLPRKLRITFLAEIDTTGQWRKQVQKVAKRIKKL